MALQTCAISVTVSAPDGSPIANAIVVAELSERVMQEGVVIPERVVVKTDSMGMAMLNLWSNALLSVPRTYYMIIISTPQGAIETFYITVPDAATANMRDLERIEAPVTDREEAARLVATLADLENQTKNEVNEAVAALHTLQQTIAGFDARIKAPRFWEGTVSQNQALYDIAGATIAEPEFYDVVVNGIPQRPNIDYKIIIDKSEPANSQISLIGDLPVGRNWWALIRSVVTNPNV